MKREHRAHKRIRPSKLHNYFTSQSLFTQNRHNTAHLAELATSFSRLRGRHVTPKQARSISHYNNEPRFNLSNDITHTPDEEVIALYFYLLDDMYFFGSLAPRCDIILDPEEAKNLGYNGKNRSYKRWKIKRNNSFDLVLYKTKRCKITLYRRDTEAPLRWERLHMYLGTLLHEMVHAFLMLWACRHGDCGADTWQKVGLYGHGCVWQDIALALERAVNEDPICLDLTLTRAPALVRESRLTRRRITRDELERWHIDYYLVQQILDWKGKAASFCLRGD